MRNIPIKHLTHYFTCNQYSTYIKSVVEHIVRKEYSNILRGVAHYNNILIWVAHNICVEQFLILFVIVSFRLYFCKYRVCKKKRIHLYFPYKSHKILCMYHVFGINGSLITLINNFESIKVIFNLF